jgi:hypothetical protein
MSTVSVSVSGTVSQPLCSAASLATFNETWPSPALATALIGM